MAYVRQHGNQLAIVAGARNSETSKVEQHVLFTFYSKDETRAAIGKGSDRQKSLFHALMTDTYPNIDFDWPKIYQSLEEKMSVLPEKYESRTAHSGEEIAKAIKALTVQLAILDPLIIPSSQEILISQKSALLAIKELTECSLKRISIYESQGPEKPNEFTNDEFHWRYTLRSSEVAQSVEEWAEGFYERRDYEKAECIFQGLVKAFDNYAEGYNYLGLIALEQQQFRKAIECFEKTISVGRKLFPGNLPKKDYWRNLETRPFMRGMSNLIIALLCNGEYEKAEKFCDRYEKECGDRGKVNAFRASINLSMGKWEKALALADSENLIKGFALLEIGKPKEALKYILLEATEHPHTVRIILGMKRPKITNFSAAEDNNYGLHYFNQLQGYFAVQSASAKKFLKALAKQPAFIEIMNKIDKRTFDHVNGPHDKHKENFDAWHKMQDPSYAASKAKEISAEIEKSFLMVKQ